MNKEMFNKGVYFNKNNTINYAVALSYIQFFASTMWQRSAEDNAKGFEFFASLWRDKNLVHRGALEQVTKKKEKPQPKEESAE